MKTLATTSFQLIALFFTLTTHAQLRSSGCNTPSIQLTEVNHEITINWTTVKEVNSSYFLIESSEDSVHFTTVARVSAAGSSIFPRTYQHVDIANGSSRYYRVTLLDMNRTRFCSTVVAIPVSDSAITSK
jgi:hypothetical protein